MSEGSTRKKPAMRKPSRRRELAGLAAMPEKAINTSDIPERADWRQGHLGKFYRPVKQQITLRIDADVIAWFKARGEGYQTALNNALRQHSREHAAPLGKLARTGDPCPESGVWKPLTGKGAAVPIALGNRMPPHQGMSTMWKLVQRA